MTKKTRFTVDFILAASLLSFGLGLLDSYLFHKFGKRLDYSFHHGGMVLGLSAVFATMRAHSRNVRKVQFASQEATAQALEYSPAVDAAVVYVFRDARCAWKAGFNIEVDGAVCAQTRGKTFVRLVLPPGRHTFASISLADDARAECELSCTAGEVIFIEQFIALGALRPRQEMRVTTADVAKPRISKCRLIERLGPSGTAA